MTTKAFQRIYTQLEAITKATVSLRAAGVANDELAIVDGRLAQVVKIKDDLITLQIFEGTEGIPTNAEVLFFGEPPALNVSDDLAGRFSTHTANLLMTVPQLRRKTLYRRPLR